MFFLKPRSITAAVMLSTLVTQSAPAFAGDSMLTAVSRDTGTMTAIEGPIHTMPETASVKTTTNPVDQVSGWDVPLPVSTAQAGTSATTQPDALTPSQLKSDADSQPSQTTAEPVSSLKSEASDSQSEESNQQLSATTLPTATESVPLVIDNDEETGAVIPEKYELKQVTGADGKQKISAGATFPVSLISTHNSKTARVGDPVEARLKHDLRIGGNLIATRGSKVTGHVSMSAKARRILAAELSAKRWMRANGAIGLQFDEIINESGEHLPLIAAPARSARIVKNTNEGRVLGVNHNGEVAAPLSTQLKHQAAHLAIRGAASAAGVFSFGIVPVAYGVVGAINPSFAFLHPVGKNVPHRRLKGFAMGLVAGMPGGFLIADSIIKGQEAVVKPGDEFMVEFKQDFSGEPATDAELVNGATTRVEGQVVPQAKKK